MTHFNSRLFSLMIMLFLPLVLATACKEDEQVQYEFPDPDKNKTELPSQWQPTTDLTEGFPEGVEVYRNTTAYNGKAMNAYCVIFDPADPELEFKPYLAGAAKKPATFVDEEEGTIYACINGGFFGPGVSYSLVSHESEIAAVNIKALTRQYNGVNTTYYPTRGAFGITTDNQPEVTWMYNVGSGMGTMYSYPTPSPNKLNTEPQPQPSSTFPEGGKEWTVTSAIGGSPVLIKGGEVNITDDEELIAVNNTTSRARSAIGHLEDGKVVLLAVEGNNPEGATGLNLSEMANLMKDMGCVAALNLDGGGSTSMIVNGQETVKPSDAGGERAVMSVIFLKKK